MGENLKSLEKENDRLRDQITNLSSKDFEIFKEKMAAEVATSTTACTKLPNGQDVQFLSDGYDELVNSSKGMAEAFQKLESRLNIIEFHVADYNAKQ